MSGGPPGTGRSSVRSSVTGLLTYTVPRCSLSQLYATSKRSGPTGVTRRRPMPGVATSRFSLFTGSFVCHTPPTSTNAASRAAPARSVPGTAPPRCRSAARFRRSRRAPCCRSRTAGFGRHSRGRRRIRDDVDDRPELVVGKPAHVIRPAGIEPLFHRHEVDRSPGCPSSARRPAPPAPAMPAPHPAGSCGTSGPRSRTG